MSQEGRFLAKILSTEDDSKMIFIRLIVSFIFIVEGIMKFLSLEVYGPGFFDEIGFHHSFFWTYFTGIFEITCGILVLLGLLTRAASVPLLVIMITAFITTKLPLLSTRGFFSFAHAYTTDFSLTVLLVLLLKNGGGKYSTDIKIMQKKFSS